ncbi:mannose-1-phosphate guanylyltransferase/mannose-6-phosphate isomerase [Bermanella sp. 47_1433_sub80_T6]|nr:mannose-1-phosphate guanylyltransferase/mannose-6-phosphate isomerase [Bermanella sp. 47_1433_sub80_T6]
MAIYPVVLAGGSGSRLWPISRSNHPKQFLDLLQQGQTLLQQSIERARLCSNQAPLIIANEQHRFLLKQQLAPLGLSDECVLLEPEAKNTAASVLIACLHALQKDPEARVFILPSDHFLPDSQLFARVIKSGFEKLTSSEIILLAIEPGYPSTQFGYLNLAAGEGLLTELVAFVEKPDLNTAQKFLASDHYFWNAGVVLAHARHLVSAFEKYQPVLYNHICHAYQSRKKFYDFTLLGAEMRDAASISFDYAVLEKSENLKALKYSGDWDDLGNWKSLLLRRKQLGLPSAFTKGDKISLVKGVDDLVVVNDDDLLLVAHQDSIHDLNAITELLVDAKRMDLLAGLDVCRPWGSFKVLAQGDNFLVKQLSVQPGAQISLQSHSHRSEHWVVIAGEAVVELDEVKSELTQGQAITIKCNEKHRLTNSTSKLLQIIEVQTGSYLDESDIVRYDDIYDRHLEK